MTDHLFEPPLPATLAVTGDPRRFPVRRIFCVGRNYVAHAREMGVTPDFEAPFYFTKSPLSIAPSGAEMAYPPGTSDLHHEVELAVGLGAPAYFADQGTARAAIMAYGVALDMTRRDLQQTAKDGRRPWDVAKDFEGSAVMADLCLAGSFTPGPDTPITLSVNGRTRQSAVLGDMIHSVVGIIQDLSTYYHLGPGDVILTGTPSGVGPVVPGDHLIGRVGDLPAVDLTIGPPDSPGKRS